MPLFRGSLQNEDRDHFSESDFIQTTVVGITVVKSVQFLTAADKIRPFIQQIILRHPHLPASL